jgi:ADP-heptose:LPS heptosyltransferase
MSVASDRVKNVAGTTNLIQLAAKVAGFKALVVGDTGPLHIAIAVKTPSVGLYGSQSAIDGAAPIQDLAIHQFIRSPEEQSG